MDEEPTPRINSFYAPKPSNSRVSTSNFGHKRRISSTSNFGMERRVSDISGAEINDDRGSGVLDIPNPSVVTLGQPKSRMVGGGAIQST